MFRLPRQIGIKLISFIVLFTALTGHAQLDPNRLIESSEVQGNNVYGVLSDRKGNIWMASQSGLMRYDGYEIKRFYPDLNDTSTIGSILTYSLYEDKTSKIWIGGLGYISTFDPVKNSFVNYQIRELTDFPIYAQPFVFSAATDNHGRIYFGVGSFLGIESTHALIYYDLTEGRMKRFESPDSLPIKNVSSLSVDKNDNIWVKSPDNIYMIDTLHQTHRINFPGEGINDQSDRISSILCDNTGKVLMASENYRLYSYDPETGTYSHWSFSSTSPDKNDRIHVHNMAFDETGNVWMASTRGLICFEIKNERFERFMDENLNRLEIFDLHFDSFGDLWLATANGLMRYTGRTILKSFIHHEDNAQSITSGWVTKIFEDVDGKVWLASDGDILHGGIDLYDPSTGKLIPFTYNAIIPGMESYNVIGMSGPGEFIVITNKGPYRCTPLENRYAPAGYLGVDDTTYIFRMMTDSYGNTLFGTTWGLYIKEKNGQVRHLDLSTLPGSNLISNEVVRTIESKKYGLWILTNYGLFLYHYDTDKVDRVGNDNTNQFTLSSQDINSLYEDNTGIVWVGTWQGGLCRLDPVSKKVKVYTQADGLPSNSIQGILGDEQNGVLWLSTFEGISRFSIKEEKFNNFSMQDGIQGMLYTDGSYLKSADGTFFFGGNSGVTYFNSKDVKEQSKVPLVYITDFKAADSSITGRNYNDRNGLDRAGEFILSYSQNNISINYTAIHYANPARNEFAYKLENYDDDLRQVRSVRTAYYYNLPPGHYTFRVKAANSNGVWNDTGDSISFRVLPPWWRTWWAYMIYGLILAAGVFAVDRIQRRRLLEREHRLAREKELKHAREIEKAYQDLKATQAQLIHSEKMASLGELTAGIAHEIQNPLNFVNNFSEINSELISEMKQELDQGNMLEAKTLANNIDENEKKINFHGKRADGIVKGMLQHSRVRGNVKEPTDINTLADEYLRLAYHGLRAKDRSFSADYRTELDPALPKVNIIAQDIGRVLLNLINNAFYAVTEKKKQVPENYQPIVEVSTHNSNGHIEISVKDNGNGIPDSVREKIFQPFFTTKPTGEGTGLGLSLSYDIITKGHGGDIKLATKQGEGTEFTVILPKPGEIEISG